MAALCGRCSRSRSFVCYYHRKEQLTHADSASLPELDLLPFLFGLIRNPCRYGNTRQRWIKLS
ncbi:hypothetical protein T06_1251 [Trichinella sp. T6]|nr:hypothetical protein T06_1251 [Trichinella sp. T6]